MSGSSTSRKYAPQDLATTPTSPATSSSTATRSAAHRDAHQSGVRSDLAKQFTINTDEVTHGCAPHEIALGKGSGRGDGSDSIAPQVFRYKLPSGRAGRMLSDFAASSLWAAALVSLLSSLGRFGPPVQSLSPRPEPAPADCVCRCEVAAQEPPAPSYGAWIPYLLGFLLFAAGLTLGCCLRFATQRSSSPTDRGPRRGVWTQPQKLE